MSSLRPALLAMLLIAGAAPALLAQPAGQAAPNMACRGPLSPQWDQCVGVHTYLNDNVYRGEYHHGQREGLGMIVIRARGLPNESTIAASEESVYVGQFRGDHLNGHGLFFTPHVLYAGSFVNNLAQPDVSLKDCKGEPSGWSNCLARVPSVGGNEYTGEIMHGVREGFGLLQINERGASDANASRAPQQAFYVGELKNGHLNGRGMLIMQDGTGYSGLFKDNVLITPAFAAAPAAPAGGMSEFAAAVAKLMGPAQQQGVIRAAASSPVIQRNPCANAQASIDPAYFAVKALTADAAGRIVSGAWKEIVRVRGCGSERQLNVLVSVEAAGRLTIAPLLPGSTRADPLLQKDAVRSLLVALKSAPGAQEPDCNIGYVADTQFVEEDKGDPAPGARSRPWHESWTFAACTQQMIVPMRFIPDATGTAISAGPAAQIKVVPLGKGRQVRRLPAVPREDPAGAALGAVC